MASQRQIDRERLDLALVLTAVAFILKWLVT